MSQIVINPSQLSGTVVAPPSKSLSHRVMIAAALSEGKSIIEGIKESVDINATRQCLENLGANFIHEGETMIIDGIGKPSELKLSELHCEESGSTLRFMIPIAALSGKNISFHGKGKLTTRPIDPYFDVFERSEITYQYNTALPLEIQGVLKSGIYEMPGHISSQFVTGLIMALPLCDGDSELVITSKLESRDYVDLTLQVLEQFGIEVINDDYKRFIIKGNQKYKAQNARVEGDYSQIAFWAVAGTIGENGLRIENASRKTRQGDSRILEIISSMGGQIEWQETTLVVKPAKTKNRVIDVSEIPDLVPILAVLGTKSSGTMEIVGGARVRLKESDRLKAIATELNKVGGDVKELDEGLLINGVDSLSGGFVDGWNDHRIVMAMSVAATVCSDSLTIDGWEAISKSYPEFFKDYRQLGGHADERNMG